MGENMIKEAKLIENMNALEDVNGKGIKSETKKILEHSLSSIYKSEECIKETNGRVGHFAAAAFKLSQKTTEAINESIFQNRNLVRRLNAEIVVSYKDILTISRQKDLLSSCLSKICSFIKTFSLCVELETRREETPVSTEFENFGELFKQDVKKFEKHRNDIDDNIEECNDHIRNISLMVKDMEVETDEIQTVIKLQHYLQSDFSCENSRRNEKPAKYKFMNEYFERTKRIDQMVKDSQMLRSYSYVLHGITNKLTDRVDKDFRASTLFALQSLAKRMKKIKNRRNLFERQINMVEDEIEKVKKCKVQSNVENSLLTKSLNLARMKYSCCEQKIDEHKQKYVSTDLSNLMNQIKKLNCNKETLAEDIIKHEVNETDLEKSRRTIEDLLLAYNKIMSFDISMSRHIKDLTALNKR